MLICTLEEACSDICCFADTAQMMCCSGKWCRTPSWTSVAWWSLIRLRNAPSAQTCSSGCSKTCSSHDQSSGWSSSPPLTPLRNCYVTMEAFLRSGWMGRSRARWCTVVGEEVWRITSALLLDWLWRYIRIKSMETLWHFWQLSK